MSCFSSKIFLYIIYEHRILNLGYLISQKSLNVLVTATKRCKKKRVSIKMANYFLDSWLHEEKLSEKINRKVSEPSYIPVYLSFLSRDFHYN